MSLMTLRESGGPTSTPSWPWRWQVMQMVALWGLVY
jgi:hypothetical protein